MYTIELFALAISFVSVQISLQASTAYDSHYSAGVVEFRPSTKSDSEARLVDNLEGYLTILNTEEAKNLDVIAFPESTLNDNSQAIFVPNPTKNLVVPCAQESGQNGSLLVNLSCAAKKLSAYIVINLTEKERCATVPEDTRPCSQTGFNLFNTNVVFDRRGTVISRYRKLHLFGENKNTTLIPEVGWFDTDFGIRFGHFICFDILFFTPGQSMVVHNGIKDFVFTSMWFSQLPFLTAVQVHQAWSYANNVNLLAAGASNPLGGSTGTGIYHGRQGIVLAKMNQGIGERKLYVAKVPKYRFLSKRSLFESPTNLPTTPTAANIRLKRDYLQSYETILLDLNSNSSLQREVCFSNSTFCCHFELKWRSLNQASDGTHYQYRLGVYDGLRNEVAAETNYLKNCAVFSCVNDDIMECGKLFDSELDVIFENISIIATFPKAERFLIMPNSLNADVMPLPVSNFQWQETHKKNSVHIRYELNTTTSNIMAFSIYGNYYDCIADVVPDEYNDNEGDGAASLPNLLVGVMASLLINLMS